MILFPLSVKWRAWQVGPDLEPLFDTMSIKLYVSLSELSQVYKVYLPLEALIEFDPEFG